MNITPTITSLRFGNDWDLQPEDFQGEAAEAHQKTQDLIFSVDRASSQEEANITLEEVYANNPEQFRTAIDSAHSSDHPFFRYLSHFLLEKTQQK